jgi:hypothetical protein
MALELNPTIELKDLSSVEFRCKNCGHASTRKLDDVLRLPVLCGNCDSRWQMNEGHDGQELLRFLRDVRSYAAKERPYSLRFHVEGLAQLLK